MRKRPGLATDFGLQNQSHSVLSVNMVSMKSTAHTFHTLQQKETADVTSYQHFSTSSKHVGPIVPLMLHTYKRLPWQQREP